MIARGAVVDKKNSAASQKRLRNLMPGLAEESFGALSMRVAFLHAKEGNMCTILAKGPSIARSHAALRHVFPFAPTFLRRSSRINAVPHSFNVSPDEASRALPGVSWGLRYDAEPGIDVLTPPIPNDGGDELEPYRSADAIVVLAGGQDGAYALPSWVERRLDAALSLHKLQRTPCPVLCLGESTAL